MIAFQRLSGEACTLCECRPYVYTTTKGCSPSTVTWEGLKENGNLQEYIQIFDAPDAEIELREEHRRNPLGHCKRPAAASLS